MMKREDHLRRITEYLFQRPQTLTEADDENTDYNKLEYKPKTLFCTGSSYKGQWNALGMSGFGDYNMFYNVEYKGNVKDGTFHGVGWLKYPNNAQMEAKWENGTMVTQIQYKYSDDKVYGPYCQMPDRRFNIEIRHGLKPAGKSFLRNEFETRIIPKDCYDVGDGFYNPKTKCVIDAKDPKKILRIPKKLEHNWIIKHCRKAWDEPSGYRPDLYENWKKENEDELIPNNDI